MTLASPLASQVVPGVLGFLVVAGMGIVLFFLLRSMNKQLRKVMGRPRWQDDAGQEPPSSGPGDGGQTGGTAPSQDFQENGSARP
jgi:hypothetical protein